MTRADRRFRFTLAKERAKRIMKIWFGPKAPIDDPRMVAHNAETHCRPCSCFICKKGINENSRDKRTDTYGV